MGQQAFDYGAAPAYVTTWNGWGGFYSNIPGTPVGRAMKNGDTRILPTGIVMYIGGYSGAITATIYVGGASLGVNCPASNGGQAVGGATSTRALVGGGGAGVQAGSYMSGSGYQGMNTVPGRTVYHRDGSAVSGREIAGYYDFAEAPTAPGTPVVTLNGQNAAVSWATPATGGGVAILGYALQYSTSPTFSSDVTTVNLGNVNSANIALPNSGVTYYFRVAAKTEVTNLAGTTGVDSGTTSVFVASGGAHRQSGAWRPRIRRWWNGSSWRPVRRWYRDAGTWKPIK